ncbi:MAG: UDP-N-acetylglucosamine 2-epimerase (non-hydrolyzing) [Bacteroidota bacterium]
MKILFVFGTRPEAIKMAPLIKTFQGDPRLKTVVCVTGQHKEMLYQVLEFFKIQPAYDLALMKPDQTIYDITSAVLAGLKDILDKETPDLIFVQGDTTTAFTGALAGYYNQVKVAHLEAGLRSGNMYSPFPEEGNRILAGHLASYHLAPTQNAVDNLAAEGINKNVYKVGNTVIDALLLGLDILKSSDQKDIEKQFEDIDLSKRIILVTGHRRESFGEPFENMVNAIKEIAENYSDVEVVYPVHLNPNVRGIVNKVLSNTPNIHLIEPLDYPSLIWLMEKSYFVLTDSGGIQEEAPTLGKPVLVMRDITERQEGIEAGTAKLVGTNKQVIIDESIKLLDDPSAYDKMARAVNPYGDGSTSKQVLEIINFTQANQ